MSIQLYRLMEKVRNYEIKLIAGADGEEAYVSWVHIVENEEAAGFLDGGEIVFITGIGIEKNEKLISLIEYIHDKKAAAIVINLGPYIAEIPSEVCEYCNKNSFPLYTVPWKMHLAEIIRVMSYTISRDDQRNLSIAAAFKNSILFPKEEELYLVPLSQYGFLPNWTYTACAINDLSNNEDSVSINRIEEICNALLSYLNHNKHEKFAVFSNDSKLILIFADQSEATYIEIVNNIKKYLKTSLRSTEHTVIGIGRPTKSIRCLYKSYNQALAIQKLHINNRIDPELICYTQMGIYRLLIGIEDPDIITDYYKKTIEPLVEYDAKNNSDLCTVIKSYLNHNGSVKETADELFVHRNTINYKLGKVEEILNIDLQTLEARLEIKLGFMLMDMIK